MIDTVEFKKGDGIGESADRLTAQKIRRMTQPLHEQSLRETQEYFRRRFAEQKTESPKSHK